MLNHAKQRLSFFHRRRLFSITLLFESDFREAHVNSYRTFEVAAGLNQVGNLLFSVLFRLFCRLGNELYYFEESNVMWAKKLEVLHVFFE